MARTLTPLQSIERSIIKKYRKELWNPFIAAVKRYDLIRPGDCVAACISGGKDSSLCALLLRELNRHSDRPFTLKFLVMDPGYNSENRAILDENLRTLGVDAEIFETDLFDTVANMDGSPCYMCARMRRGNLYKFAQSIGCNKIALGHHLDDVAETTLMGMLYGGQLQGMMPKLKSKNFPGMELIRPLYCVEEKDVKAWAHYNNLSFLRCACRFTEYCAVDDETGGSKRQEMKRLIRTLSEVNPSVKKSIFSSIHSVSLDTMVEYSYKGQTRNFLDTYYAE